MDYGSVAVAMFLAGQADTAKAAEDNKSAIEENVPSEVDDTPEPTHSNATEGKEDVQAPSELPDQPATEENNTNL